MSGRWLIASDVAIGSPLLASVAVLSVNGVSRVSVMGSIIGAALSIAVLTAARATARRRRERSAIAELHEIRRKAAGLGVDLAGAVELHADSSHEGAITLVEVASGGELEVVR